MAEAAAGSVPHFHKNLIDLIRQEIRCENDIREYKAAVEILVNRHKELRKKSHGLLQSFADGTAPAGKAAPAKKE